MVVSTRKSSARKNRIGEDGGDDNNTIPKPTGQRRRAAMVATVASTFTGANVVDANVVDANFVDANHCTADAAPDKSEKSLPPLEGPPRLLIFALWLFVGLPAIALFFLAAASQILGQPPAIILQSIADWFAYRIEEMQSRLQPIHL